MLTTAQRVRRHITIPVYQSGQDHRLCADCLVADVLPTDSQSVERWSLIASTSSLVGGRRSGSVDYIVRYRGIRDDKILCEVIGLDEQRRPTGPVAVKGTGYSKAEARAAAMAATSDASLKTLLEAAPV